MSRKTWLKIFAILNFTPRSDLTVYLSPEELLRLLEYSAAHLEYGDFTIISSMASTGVRPSEIVQLKRSDVHLDACYIDVAVKGDWVKKTPLSISMVAILKEYMSSRNDQCKALFVNKRRGKGKGDERERGQANNAFFSASSRIFTFLI